MKKKYYKDVITKSKNQMKTTWNIIHKEINNTTNKYNIKPVRINNHMIYNQISIANELNNYFLNIAGSKNNNKINEKEDHYNIYLNTLTSHLSWPYTSSKEINKIDSLKSKNSCGYDEISTNIIKISKPFIISPLINTICNKMPAQGIYPERMKFSLINL